MGNDVMWGIKNSDILKFAVAVAMITIPAIIVGLVYGVQYIGPVATVITVIILAVQAWYNKKTAELMKQSIMIPLRREHTEQLKNEALEPLYEIFSQLKMKNNKLRIEKSNDVGTLVTTIDPKSLLENDTNDKESWEFLLIAFANSVNPDLEIYLLYDLVEYHLPQKFVEHFKLLVLTVTEGRESDFKEQLGSIKEILDAFRTFVVFSDDCPYIKGAIDKEEISRLIEEVKELRKNIKIEIDTEQGFYI